ncbi:UNVERIFIED_CONTAM: hypothetical protein RMT77_001892 [Armadillidium vulgare]
MNRNLIPRTINKFSVRNMVKLSVSPLKCLHDEPIQIVAENLPPHSDVTLLSLTKDPKQRTFITNTHYKSDKDGIVDLSKHPSLGGTFKGLFPMGPIANLRPAPDVPKYTRYFKKDVTTPMTVNFRLLKGHLNEELAVNPDEQFILDSVTHERIYMTENTTRIPIKEGRVRGALFIPKGEGPFPGVIDLFGNTGGLIEHRAAQLAAHGFASFAVAYLGYDDLPKELDELDLSYFEDSLNILLNQPMVKKSGVGAVGVSKGADIVCSIGTYLPKVKAVVCINGLPVNTWSPMRYKDIVVPGLPVHFDRLKLIEPNLMSAIDLLDDSEDFPETYIPLHKSEAEFLFICGLDDQTWDTVVETERAVKRAYENGKKNCEVVKYKGAGHLIEPAYAPFTPASFHLYAKCPAAWGGEPFFHSEAQVDSWKRILKFLKRTLA